MLKRVTGLEFYSKLHRYRLDGEWLPHNVSTVLSFDMKPEQRAAIERTKDGPDGWQVRGEEIHWILNKHLTCMATNLNHGFTYDDRWSSWAEPLLEDELFKGAKVLATEYAICDRFKGVGGTLDFLLEKPAASAGQPKRVILGDLKTVSSKKAVSSRKAATAQLAAYSSMMAMLHPEIVITDLVTVVCGPERTRVIHSDPETAWREWDEAWGRFSATQPDF